MLTKKPSDFHRAPILAQAPRGVKRVEREGRRPNVYPMSPNLALAPIICYFEGDDDSQGEAPAPAYLETLRGVRYGHQGHRAQEALWEEVPEAPRTRKAAQGGEMEPREQVEFSFKPRVEQGRGLWSAFCDELGMASCGATEDEAVANLVVTLTAFGRTLRRRGILEETLTNAEIQWKPIQTEGVRVAV